MSESLIVPCTACATLNRVPRERLRDVPVCASCRSRLLDDAPRDLDAATFTTVIGKSGLPVVVDFWAPWCGPCRTMAPQFAAAATTLRGSALLVKLDTEAEPEVAGRFGIRSIPTMVAFHRGHEIARTSGAMAAAAIVDWVNRSL
jgi:thioredoxin 2